MKLKQILTLLVLCFSLNAVTDNLNAVTGNQYSYVYVTNTIPMEYLNWEYELPIPQFDTNLGVVYITDSYLTSTLLADFYLENFKTNAINYSAWSRARIEIDGTNALIPTAIFTGTLTAFDGDTDFAGTSGIHKETNVFAFIPLVATNSVYVIATGDCSVSAGGHNEVIFLTQAEVSIISSFAYKPHKKPK